MRLLASIVLAAALVPALAAPASAGWLRQECYDSVPFRAAPLCNVLPDSP